MTHNVDDLLIGVPTPKQEVKEPAPSSDEAKPIVSEQQAQEPEKEAKENNTPSNEDAKTEDSKTENTKAENIKTEDGKDEYGNDIPKARMYSEEEVQRMIRERLQRGSHQQQSPQQQNQQQQEIAQASKDFEFDENSDANWQEQLAAFIDNRVDAKARKDMQRAEEVRQQRAMAEFEAKFTQGMSRYPDFAQAVQDKPITDAMVLATRAMNDPAAFLYAAAKQFPTELERISKINDPLHQATEMGRLEERMRKTRAATRSTRPIESDKGDYAEKPGYDSPSIESRIESYGKSRRR